jgi:hypothetical protein
MFSGRCKYKVEPNDKEIIKWKEKIKLMRNKIRWKQETYILEEIMDYTKEDLLSLLILKNTTYGGSDTNKFN